VEKLGLFFVADDTEEDSDEFRRSNGERSGEKLSTPSCGLISARTSANSAFFDAGSSSSPPEPFTTEKRQKGKGKKLWTQFRNISKLARMHRSNQKYLK
jgi:hypothetical protein